MVAAAALEGLPADAGAKLRKTQQPGWFPPMLATLCDRPFSREGWLFEPKLDGERCLVFRRGAVVKLYSRNQKELNAKYPELVEPFRQLNTGRFILDGEIVAFEHGVTRFAKLQQRMQIRQPSAALQKRVPVWFYAFDVLYLDGYDLRQTPLRYRRHILQNAFDFREPLRLTEYREAEGEACYREACKRHWEGVIAKDGGGAYVSGRSRQWLKFKCVSGQEFVIGGYTDPQGQRVGFGALLVGYYDRGKLKYAGKVGTGYSDLTLRRLGEQLTRLETQTNPFESDGLPRSGVHWVKPKLVAQIGFTEWTTDGKLRHPRYLGLRDDKKPEDVIRER
jgi:DNA ligase D-like protein (predicted ligase)